MPARNVGVLGLVVVMVWAVSMGAQGAASAYAVAAPLSQYLMADEAAEVALARSAAPASISGGAEVLVLGKDGFTTAVKGGNGFVCLVERGFATDRDFPEFWNAKIRGPICVNAVGVKSYLRLERMQAKLVMEGKTRAEIGAAVKAARERGELPAPEAGAMSYMMSKGQYLGDEPKSWRPHLMWFAAGDATKSWGAEEGSPVMASTDPGDGMTILMVVVGHWSDGTPAPSMK
jgi:hypothetical protein